MTKTLTKEMQHQITPNMALALLKDGNKRFMSGHNTDRNLLEQAKQTSIGQFPYAVILSCIDSRTSSELIFDQGIGDIFSIRIAGNIVNEDILGSMEFACKVAGAKMIVVLGHTKCGAIYAACDQVEMGNLSILLSKIAPAVTAVQSIKQERNSNNSEFVEKVTAINIKKAIVTILEKSPILKAMIEQGEIGITGAIHDISSGEVMFYDETLMLNGEVAST